MAIIKCPECGRQISDKAPVCPNCGVEIAGKTIKCTQCGEIYFRDQNMCPNCHHMTRIDGHVGNNDFAEQPARPTSNVVSSSPLQPTGTTPANGQLSTNGQMTPPPVTQRKAADSTNGKTRKKVMGRLSLHLLSRWQYVAYVSTFTAMPKAIKNWNRTNLL